MEKEIKLITSTKDDLVLLARQITKAIPQKFVQDAENRFQIRVDGNFQSGKTIFPDYACEVLFGDNVEQHRWSATETGPIRLESYKGQNVLVALVDGNYKKYMRKAKALIREHKGIRLPCYIPSLNLGEERSFGGIDFFHNISDMTKQKFSIPEPHIHVWIENPMLPKHDYFPDIISGAQPRLKHQDRDVKKLFAALARKIKSDEQNWLRYVHVSINDDRLLKSDEFMQSWKDLCAKGCPVHNASQRSEVRIWGITKL